MRCVYEAIKAPRDVRRSREGQESSAGVRRTEAGKPRFASEGQGGVSRGWLCLPARLRRPAWPPPLSRLQLRA